MRGGLCVGLLARDGMVPQRFGTRPVPQKCGRPGATPRETGSRKKFALSSLSLEPFFPGTAQFQAMSSRNLRCFVARLLVGVLLFAQLAVAAYACTAAMPDPALAGSVDSSAMVGHGAAAPPTHIDPDQPALCLAHCRSGQQTAGVEPLPIPPLALVAGYFTLESIGLGAEMRGRHVDSAGGVPPIADPPQRILHCCLRI